MQCPECGFEIDEVNESISVCPLCGTDPNDPHSRPDITDHPMVVDALAELADMRREEAERLLQEEPASKMIN